MREMILLGAGASVEAKVPDTFDMTRRMLELFDQDPHISDTCSRALRFAAGGLLFQRGIKGEDPFEGVNVEELFNAVQLLAERETLEAAPFIGSWHPLVETLDRLRPPKPNFDKLPTEIVKAAVKAVSDSGKQALSSSSGRDLDTLIDDLCRGKKPSKKLGQIVVDLVKNTFDKLKPGSPSGLSFSSELSKAIEGKERPGRGAIFRRTTSWMVQMLTRMVWIDDPNRVSYLQPLVQVKPQEIRVIASLNYDNAVESAASQCGVAVETGIDTWSQEQTFPKAKEGVSLLKLHGSIDWAIKEGNCTPERPLPYQTIERISPNPQKMGFFPAVIFGGRNKLTAAGPFLDLLRAFQSELRSTDRLTVIGYSFRDDHINEYIAEWLNGNTSRAMRIINGPHFRRTNVEFARELIQIARSQPRIEITDDYAVDGIQRFFCRTSEPPLNDEGPSSASP